LALLPLVAALLAACGGDDVPIPDVTEGDAPELYSFYADSGYAADGTLSLHGGQLVHLRGKNLHGVLRIYLATSLDDEGAGHKPIDQYQVDDDATLIHLLMPSRLFSTGWFVVECERGTASLPFSIVVADVSTGGHSMLPTLTEEGESIDLFR